MTNDPRYPIGRFAPPAAWDPVLIDEWRQQIDDFPIQLEAAVSGLEAEQLDTPYREGGWTVRQLVHHLADSHLNAYTRFKLAITEDAPVIKPYDEVRWADLADSSLPIAPSLAILVGLHTRWAALLTAMTPEQYQRTWFHPESQAVTPLWRALGLYAWHGKHHIAHITTLRQRQGW